MKSQIYDPNHPWSRLSKEEKEALSWTELKRIQNYCMKCETSGKAEVRNHSAIWGDGDVYCSNCGAYIRMWDSG